MSTNGPSQFVLCNGDLLEMMSLHELASANSFRVWAPEGNLWKIFLGEFQPRPCPHQLGMWWIIMPHAWDVQHKITSSSFIPDWCTGCWSRQNPLVLWLLHPRLCARGLTYVILLNRHHRWGNAGLEKQLHVNDPAQVLQLESGKKKLGFKISLVLKFSLSFSFSFLFSFFLFLPSSLSFSFHHLFFLFFLSSFLSFSLELSYGLSHILALLGWRSSRMDWWRDITEAGWRHMSNSPSVIEIWVEWRLD